MMVFKLGAGYNLDDSGLEASWEAIGYNNVHWFFGSQLGLPCKHFYSILHFIVLVFIML